VYEPADDTYLLLDGLGVEFDGGGDDTSCGESGADSGKLLENKADKVVTTLELGCGTGVVTTYLAKTLFDRRRRKRRAEGGRNDAHVISPSNPNVTHYVTDLNAHAVQAALRTAAASGLPRGTVEAILCDLASPLLDRLTGKVDVLIFNPPYVPTPDDEVGSTGIEASWAGGRDGRVVLDRALPQIARLLSWPHGVAYVITVDDNLPEDIADMMMEKYGVIMRPLVRRKARNEYLAVQKMTLSRSTGNIGS